MNLTKNQFKADYLRRLTLTFAQTPSEASLEHKYLALGKLSRDYISESSPQTNTYYTINKCKHI